MLEKVLALLFADTELAGEQVMPVSKQEVSTGFGFGWFCFVLGLFSFHLSMSLLR